MRRVWLDRNVWLLLVGTSLAALLVISSGHMLLEALTSGTVPCHRRCRGVYEHRLADDPVSFWITLIWLVPTLACAGCVGVLVFLSGLREALAGARPVRRRRRRIDASLLRALRDAMPEPWSSALLVLEWPATGAVAPKLRILNPGSGEELWLSNEALRREAWRLLDLYREHDCAFRRAIYSISRTRDARPARTVRFEYGDDQSARNAGDVSEAVAA